MFDFQIYVTYFDTWISALTDPEQFLAPSFNPQTSDFDAGLEFFFAVLTVTVLIFGALSFFAAGAAAGSKLRMFANALFGIITLFAGAAAVYFAFALLGGSSSFKGTLLTYIYAAIPYGPITALVACIRIGGMAPELRARALKPIQAREIARAAWNHPETDKFVFVIGSWFALGILAWSIYVTFRCFSYAQNLHGWRLAIAIALSFVVVGLVGRILKPLEHFFTGVSGTDITLASGAATGSVVPGSAVVGGGAANDGKLP